MAKLSHALPCLTRAHQKTTSLILETSVVHAGDHHHFVEQLTLQWLFNEMTLLALPAKSPKHIAAEPLAGPLL
jgi:hypothetical protein